MISLRLGALAASATLTGACALSAPPAENVLTTAAGPASAPSLDEQVALALRRSKAEPGDRAAAIAAAELLFQAADLRLQQASVQLLERMPDADLDAVLSIDDRIAEAERTAILSLCTAGVEAAERAVAARPEAVDGQLQLGLHLSLVAWANGPARSLFAGYGPRLVRAIDAALATEALWQRGAPLRLSGRFRSKAPWPYGDVPAAVAALRRAVAAAPIVVNRLFLGDALWAAGDRAAARVEWQAAAVAPGDEATRWSDDLLRQLAGRRLQALARPAGG